MKQGLQLLCPSHGPSILRFGRHDVRTEGGVRSVDMK